MYVARFNCYDDPLRVLLANDKGLGFNISNSTLYMSAGVAMHEYDSPDLPSNTVFTKADVMPCEDIMIGVLSLIIISLVTSLVYDILLRARYDGTYSPFAVAIAAALEAVERWAISFDAFDGVRAARSGRAKYSALALVLLLAVLTFSLDVALIAATQQSELLTPSDQLGFRLVTPVITHFGMGQFLRRLAPSRPCVVPALHGTTGSWRVQVQTCFSVNFTDAPARNVSYSGSVRYVSWYHSRGSDHVISAPHAHVSFALAIRSKVYQLDEQVPPLEIIRDLDAQDDDLTARLVHASAPLYFESLRLRSENLTCGHHQKELRYTHTRRRESIAVAQSIKGIVLENATMYETAFQLNTSDLHWWLVHALGSAAASVGIGVTSTPTYILGERNEPESLDTNVYSRKSRRCTVATLALIVFIVGTVKLIIRAFLRPLSLHRIANLRATETLRDLACGRNYDDVCRNSWFAPPPRQRPSEPEPVPGAKVQADCYDEDMLTYEQAYHLYMPSSKERSSITR